MLSLARAGRRLKDLQTSIPVSEVPDAVIEVELSLLFGGHSVVQ